MKLTRNGIAGPARLLTVAVIAVVAASTLTACERAPDLQQKRIDNPIRADSINATVGSLTLLAVRIETPSDGVHVEGENVGLFLTIANSGTTADTLTAAQTVDAEAIVYRDGMEQPAPRISVEIPPGGVTSMQYPGGPHLELVGLKRDVYGGRFMPVTFRFADAGTATLNVFVQGFAHPTVSPLSVPPASVTTRP
jgi:copper(I)-binding protein